MPEVPLPADPRAQNRAWWDAMAHAHRVAKDGYYDPAPLIAGKSSFGVLEDAALDAAFPYGVDGLDVLHLQCHLGLDAITLARKGAKVTGVDFSPAALDGARELAARCGVDLELVEADALNLPRGLRGRFDLVWATIGVLTWHSDLRAWMASAASALRPGGRLVNLELHPLYCMPASLSPLTCDFPYAFDRGHAYDEPASYAGAELRPSVTVSVSWPHSLGEIVTAAVGAGLHVERLDEHLATDMDPRGTLLVKEADGLYRWRLPSPDGGPGLPVPVMYTLILSKPS